MSLENWVPTLAMRLAEIDGLDGGVRVTPRQDQSAEGLPLKMGEFPIILIVPSGGLELNYASGAILSDHTMITMSLYTAQGFLPEAADLALGFVQKVKDKMAQNHTLGGLLSHIRPLSPWWEGPAGLEYAGSLYTGINFFYEAKEKNAAMATLLTG